VTQETPDQADHVAAAAWFGEALGPGDWVNATWISHSGLGELRIIDIIGADARHRVLVRSTPDGIDDRWDDLDYDGVMEIVDRVRQMSIANDLPLWDFAGPATAAPIASEE
jgi:hypothetical protein